MMKSMKRAGSTMLLAFGMFMTLACTELSMKMIGVLLCAVAALLADRWGL